MPSFESFLITAGIIVGILAGIVTILGGIAGVYRVLFGEPLIPVLRGWFARMTHKMNRLKTYLPEDPNSAGILKKVIDHLAKGENQKALDEVNQILGQMGYTNDADFIDSEVSLKDPLFICNAFTLKGEALVLLGQEEGLAILGKSIQILETFAPNGPSQDQQKEHILGRAYNDVAYYSRVHKNYPKAELDFWRALPHLHRSKNQIANAHTLKNLAYTYALQGKIIAADILCQDAIKIFEELGDDSGKALGLNTLGLICVESRQHEIGEIQCKVALGIFRALGDMRGIGLASIGLGYSLRRLSSTDINPEINPIASLGKAKTYLNNSIEIFTTKQKEPARLVEAYSELGCLYRDWAKFLRSKSKSATSEIQKLEKDAIRNLETSLALAKELGMVVEQGDVLEDIAQVYFLQGDYARALARLDEAESLVLTDYFIDKNGQLPQVENPVTPFWSLLGKVMLLRGHIEFDRSSDRDSSKWYVIAGAYFDLFSESTTLTDYAARSIYDQVRDLKLAQLDAWRFAMNSTSEKLKFGRTRMIKILDQTLGVIDSSSGNSDRVFPVMV